MGIPDFFCDFFSFFSQKSIPPLPKYIIESTDPQEPIFYREIALIVSNMGIWHVMEELDRLIEKNWLQSEKYEKYMIFRYAFFNFKSEYCKNDEGNRNFDQSKF